MCDCVFVGVAVRWACGVARVIAHSKMLRLLLVSHSSCFLFCGMRQRCLTCVVYLCVSRACQCGPSRARVIHSCVQGVPRRSPQDHQLSGLAKICLRLPNSGATFRPLEKATDAWNRLWVPRLGGLFWGPESSPKSGSSFCIPFSLGTRTVSVPRVKHTMSPRRLQPGLTSACPLTLRIIVCSVMLLLCVWSQLAAPSCLAQETSVLLDDERAASQHLLRMRSSCPLRHRWVAGDVT